ncbi:MULTISPECIES: MerR family transcriptional regulator [unclassified Caballeronia]|uniref:MerR family transcriptional regulator n=1 Tax=unclassified Caballeronia TaxID=2646786 RepID=UPI00285F8027|nr:MULTISPECIES: MerR family transcriptional regulator [unclassified Caballeronia]MDR5736875.1 MerR family transcriptional regulator [Caballeronia sp. LZ016]MDR5810593.1 MerR family transcriptional regulator [Caballeronia sp. LZ019]
MTNSSNESPVPDEDAGDTAQGDAAAEPARSHGFESGLTGIGIGAIAQEIGLTKDTLRVWERRYGFPQPLRSPGGERLYPQEQVSKLRLVKRLLDAGHRPSKVLAQPVEQLQQLAQSSGIGQDAPDVELDQMVALLRNGAYEDFRFGLLKRATREGLERFVLDVAAPLSARVGNAWASGTLQVYHEHLFSEALQVTLRSLMRPLSDAVRARGGRPRLLLTTLSGEGHGLGILMAEAMFTLSECTCIQLGLQTPLHDIASAVRAHEIDVVALSFTSVLPAQVIANVLTELRSMLPAHVRMWVGGSSPALRRKIHEGVDQLPGLTAIEESVAAWRSASVLSSAGLPEQSQTAS